MNKIDDVKKLIEEKLIGINSMEELNAIKSEFLGKKGFITELQGLIKEVENDKKKEFGMKLNEVKSLFNSKYEEIKSKIEEDIINKRLEEEAIDVTLPSDGICTGSLHPFNRIIEEVEDLFVSMGYDVVDGPELETDEYCFKRLNVPEGHPARDMQDTFYITNEYLLRTQTSSSQAHTMEDSISKEPIRMICPGKVYRRDDDATHSHQFGQVEGLVVDKDISLADLKGTLEIFAKKLIGENTKVRFRPSYFPFTEPSVEVDLSCFKCGGKGCNLCKGTGFIEVLGAGMVHPDVLRMGGYDPKVYTGFAFGTGLDRLAMFKYNIPDIRYLYTNDIRMLKQFDRKDAGIDTILLKGSGIAELYPVPELRKSGDIDLLFEDGKKACAAGACLETHGFVLESRHQENHHLAYMSREGIRLELHSALVEPFDSAEVNDFLEKCQREFFEYRVTENVMGVDFSLTAPAYQAFYLLLHMLQHFLRSGFGLKLLCDWVVFWERGCTREEEIKFLNLVKESGILYFARMVTALCVKYLGLSEDRVCFLKKQGETGFKAEETYLKDFLMEIMEAEEFGETHPERMVAMRGTGFKDYIREFHHQMLLGHPRAGRCKMLYPILWIRTFWGFVYRNRKLRGTSSIAILKNAKKRSRLVTKMKLFQKKKNEA